jgi:hypothetical protein
LRKQRNWVVKTHAIQSLKNWHVSFKKKICVSYMFKWHISLFRGLVVFVKKICQFIYWLIDWFIYFWQSKVILYIYIFKDSVLYVLTQRESLNRRPGYDRATTRLTWRLATSAPEKKKKQNKNWNLSKAKSKTLKSSVGGKHFPQIFSSSLSSLSLSLARRPSHSPLKLPASLPLSRR